MTVRTDARTSSRQRGVVLVTAVLIMAIVAAIATTLALGQQVWLRQTENLNERAQAESLRYSALDWVAILLTRAAKERTNPIDSLDQPWAKQLPPLPAEGGMITASIRDAQGLFNLNNLVRGTAASQPDIDMFKRLLVAQRIDPTLTDALVDWMDADQTPLTNGAEDSYYLGLQPSYRTANQALTSVDELRLIKGFTPQIVEQLRPFVVVLPNAAGTTINVNTAVEPVLTALFPNVASGALQTILKNRETQPFKDVSQFQQQLPPNTQVPAGITVATNTHYFLVNIDIRIGRLDSRSEALIERQDNKPATVKWHRLNPLQPALKKDEQT